MGPYYLTALVHLLGPVVAVIGAASPAAHPSGRSAPDRGRASGSRSRSTPTSPASCTTRTARSPPSRPASTRSRTTAAPIEVHGETGTLEVPDPNRFDGDVRLFALGATDWQTLEPSAGYAGAGRGIGLLDMLTSPAPRASGALALHVLDAMTSLLRSAAEDRRIDLTTTAERPDPIPLISATTWRRARDR